jgi:hypothetical protein
MHYELRDDLWFRVSQGFPRITSHGLPAGVGDISYLISVDSASAFELNREQLSELLRDAP